MYCVPCFGVTGRTVTASSKVFPRGSTDQSTGAAVMTAGTIEVGIITRLNRVSQQGIVVAATTCAAGDGYQSAVIRFIA